MVPEYMLLYLFTMSLPLQNNHFDLFARTINEIVKLLKKFRYGFLVLVLLLWGMPTFKKGDGAVSGNFASAGYFNTAYFSEEELEYIDHQITRLLIDSSFNGTVLIARYGMVIYERSFGFSSYSRAEPMNIETTFQLASISKTFTAAAVLMLHNKGLLNIDHKVTEYIPEFPYNNITIRHLLTHTSGLQNYMWLVERQWKKRQLPTNEDILQLFITHRRGLNFTPGQRFDYSNSGYVFLALLMERVSGKSYAEYVTENIFEPLEMSRSFVYDLHNPAPIENRAYGYRQSRGRHIIIPDDQLDGPLGDKGIFSTVHDLYKWDQALHRSRLLPSQLWLQAFENARLNNDTLVNYGMGWRLQNYLGKKIVHHPGRWHGFRTSFKRFVDDHSTIIVLSNNNRGILEIIEGIQDILYYDEKEIWLATHLDAHTPDEEETEQLDSIDESIDQDSEH
jgi:CubicO group peptidase (beta-lactamase class C family)